MLWWCHLDCHQKNPNRFICFEEFFIFFIGVLCDYISIQRFSLLFNGRAHHFFCLVCFIYISFFFLPLHRQLTCFSFFSISPSLSLVCVQFLCEKFLFKDTKKYIVEHWTDVKRCLKHKTLFRLHMLSSFHSNSYTRHRLLTLPWYFACISKRPIEKGAQRNAIFYQIIILVFITITIAGVANGNCFRRIHFRSWFGYHYMRSFVLHFFHSVLVCFLCVCISKNNNASSIWCSHLMRLLSDSMNAFTAYRTHALV